MKKQHHFTSVSHWVHMMICHWKPLGGRVQWLPSQRRLQRPCEGLMLHLAQRGWANLCQMKGKIYRHWTKDMSPFWTLVSFERIVNMIFLRLKLRSQRENTVSSDPKVDTTFTPLWQIIYDVKESVSKCSTKPSRISFSKLVVFGELFLL